MEPVRAHRAAEEHTWLQNLPPHGKKIKIKIKIVAIWPLAGQAVCVNHGSLIQSNKDNNPELHQLTFKLSHSFTQLMSRGSNESWIYGSVFP